MFPCRSPAVALAPDEAETAILPFAFEDLRERSVITIEGYYDESERGDAHDPLAVAGYLFKPTAYKQFCRRWKEVLRMAGGVKFLHMTDLYAGKGAYDGMPLAKRVSIFQFAVQLIDEHALAGVGLSFFQDELERLAPPGWPQRFGSNYAGACQICFQLTAGWLNEHRQFAPVFYTLESGHKFRNEVDKVLVSAAADPALKRLFRYRGHAFLDKAEAVGLQAADVLAWASTKNLSIKAGGSVPPQFGGVIEAMASDKSRYCVKLVTGEHLVKLLIGLLEQEPKRVEVGPRKRSFR